MTDCDGRSARPASRATPQVAQGLSTLAGSLQLRGTGQVPPGGACVRRRGRARITDRMVSQQARQTHDHSIRLRAASLLILFVLALILGAVGHRLPSSGHFHACDHLGDHVAADPTESHHHDLASCAACHLFQSLRQSTVPLVGCELHAHLATGPSPVCSPVGVPQREPLFAFSSRAPPLS